MSINYEKFLADEELCGMVRRLLSPIEFTNESIDLKTIKDVGIGGQYITHPKTFERCRTEFFLPDLFSRQNYEGWKARIGKGIDKSAEDIIKKRLEVYEQPQIDPEIDKALHKFNVRRKKQ